MAVIAAVPTAAPVTTTATTVVTASASVAATDSAVSAASAATAATAAATAATLAVIISIAIHGILNTTTIAAVSIYVAVEPSVAVLYVPQQQMYVTVVAYIVHSLQHQIIVSGQRQVDILEYVVVYGDYSLVPIVFDIVIRGGVGIVVTTTTLLVIVTTVTITIPHITPIP